MPLANVVSEAAAVKRALNGGGTLLVVGGRSTNFDDWTRQHPRVTIWDVTDPANDRKSPADNTKVIICTRWLGHSTFKKLQNFATKKHILMMPGLSGTGEIKEVIRMALDTATPTPTPTAPPMLTSTIDQPSKLFADPRPEPDAAAPIGGSVRAWVRAHGDLDAPNTKEAQRLLALAPAAGFPNATRGSLAQMLYVLRRERAGLPSYKGPGSHHPTTPTPPPPPPPGWSGRPVAQESNVGEALRLIDDVATGLSLLREAVLKVQTDEERMKATMTALRGFIDGGAH